MELVYWLTEKTVACKGDSRLILHYSHINLSTQNIALDPKGVRGCVLWARMWVSVFQKLRFKLPWVPKYMLEEGTQTFIITEQREVINQCIYQIYWWGCQAHYRGLGIFFDEATIYFTFFS